MMRYSYDWVGHTSHSVRRGTLMSMLVKVKTLLPASNQNIFTQRTGKSSLALKILSGLKIRFLKNLTHAQYFLRVSWLAFTEMPTWPLSPHLGVPLIGMAHQPHE